MRGVTTSSDLITRLRPYTPTRLGGERKWQQYRLPLMPLTVMVPLALIGPHGEFPTMGIYNARVSVRRGKQSGGRHGIDHFEIKLYPAEFGQTAEAELRYAEYDKSQEIALEGDEILKLLRLEGVKKNALLYFVATDASVAVTTENQQQIVLFSGPAYVDFSAGEVKERRLLDGAFSMKVWAIGERIPLTVFDRRTDRTDTVATVDHVRKTTEGGRTWEFFVLRDCPPPVVAQHTLTTHGLQRIIRTETVVE